MLGTVRILKCLNICSQIVSRLWTQEKKIVKLSKGVITLKTYHNNFLLSNFCYLLFLFCKIKSKIYIFFKTNSMLINTARDNGGIHRLTCSQSLHAATGSRGKEQHP